MLKPFFRFTSSPVQDHHICLVKEIVSFTLKESYNPGLTENIAGTIENDTVFVHVPSNPNIAALKPQIIFKGKTISPASEMMQNFSDPVVYTFTGEDGSTKRKTLHCFHSKYRS